MACDGLIFKFFSRLLPRFKTPFVASVTTGLFAGALACIFDLQELVEMVKLKIIELFNLTIEIILNF